MPTDIVDDLVQDVAARLPQGVELGKVVAIVDELVRAESGRSGRACAAVLLPGGGVPALIPRLQRLADAHPRPSCVRRALGCAAVMVAESPRVLDGDRFRLFFLAWLQGKKIEEILAVLDLESAQHKELQRRLRRVSQTVETEVIVRIDAVLPPREQVWLRAAVWAPVGRKRNARIPPPPDATSLSLLMRALDAVIHTRGVPGTTDPPADGQTTAHL